MARFRIRLRSDDPSSTFAWRELQGDSVDEVIGKFAQDDCDADPANYDEWLSGRRDAVVVIEENGDEATYTVGAEAEVRFYVCERIA